jgi:hypothetical protein
LSKILDGNGQHLQPCQDRFLHPILVHLWKKNKKNIDSQMGQTDKKNLKKDFLKLPIPIAVHETGSKPVLPSLTFRVQLSRK